MLHKYSQWVSSLLLWRAQRIHHHWMKMQLVSFTEQRQIPSVNMAPVHHSRLSRRYLDQTLRSTHLMKRGRICCVLSSHQVVLMTQWRPTWLMKVRDEPVSQDSRQAMENKYLEMSVGNCDGCVVSEWAKNKFNFHLTGRHHRDWAQFTTWSLISSNRRIGRNFSVRSQCWMSHSDTFRFRFRF